MSEKILELKPHRGKSLRDQVMELLPDGGNLNACLTCGT